jgi:hypothetical protein
MLYVPKAISKESCNMPLPYPRELMDEANAGDNFRTVWQKEQKESKKTKE